MQTFIRAAIWVSIWIVTMAITAWLCKELATKQPVILSLILLAAFVASVGPVYARQTWKNGAKGTSFAAVWVSVLAICAVTYTEASYWSSSIEGIHEEVTREKAIREGHDIVLSKRKERLSSLDVGKTPAQLEAEIAAAQVDHLWTRTAQCTDATVPESRNFCRTFHQLTADLAAAKQAHTLEGELWGIGTNQEDTGLRRDFYRAAVMASDHLGGSVQGWIAGIVIVLVLLLESLRDLSLFIAFAPSRRKAALPESIAPVVQQTDDLPESVQPIEIAAEAPDTPPEGPKPTTPPTGRFSGKSPALGPFAHRDLPANDDEDDEAYDTKVKVLRPELVDDLTQKWLDHRAAFTPINLGMQAKKIYSDYAEFCRKAMDVEPVSREHFGRSLKRKGVKSKKLSGILRYNLKIDPRAAEVAKLKEAA